MKTLIITGNSLRHKYVANKLIENLDVVGVICESKFFGPIKASKNPQDIPELEKHLERFKKVERDYFGKHEHFMEKEGLTVSYTAPSGANSLLGVIKAIGAEIVLVFGSGIIKKDIIERFPGRMINMHLGLSPYYRGSGTNVWPIINGEAQFVGVTIHYLDEGIDTGEIIVQGRPKIEPGDDSHSLGCKTIMTGVRLMIETAKEMEKGRLRSFPQEKSGKLYLTKDFDAKALEKLNEQVRNGSIKDAIGKKVKIISSISHEA